ncbi:MAG: hypothetical protein AB1640_00755 [bacterium]
MKRATARKDSLKSEQILKALEELAEKLSVRVRYDELKAFEFRIQDGGCRVKGETQVFIDRKKEAWEKIEVLARELEKLDLEGVYVPPLLREKVLRLEKPTSGPSRAE